MCTTGNVFFSGGIGFLKKYSFVLLKKRLQLKQKKCTSYRKFCKGNFCCNAFEKQLFSKKQQFTRFWKFGSLSARMF